MKCPNCGNDNILLIEYYEMHPEHYDGISEISCNDCKKRYGRWTKEEIPEGFCESMYGKKGVIVDKSALK